MNSAACEVPDGSSAGRTDRASQYRYCFLDRPELPSHSMGIPSLSKMRVVRTGVGRMDL